MGRVHFNRIFAIMMITILLVWNTFPVLSHANFITPGTAITPGQAISPGQPVTGGQFIIPGKAYKPGGNYEAGNGNLSSGLPIFPGSYLNNGAFLIPSAPPQPPGMLYWELRGIDPGNALQGGNAVDRGTAAEGGQGPSGGTAAEGGQGPSGSTAAEGGQGPSGGTAAEGGQGPSGGTAAEGGQGPSGGTAAEGGQGPNGGTAAEGGQGPNGGTAAEGGQGPNGGTAAEGGEGPSGGTVAEGGEGPNGGTAAEGGEGPNGGTAAEGGQGSNGGVAGEGGQGSNGSGIKWNLIEAIHGTAKEAKTWLVSNRTKAEQLLDGTLSLIAGFQIKDLNTHIGNRNLHEIVGKKNFTNSKNPIANWLDSRYQKYLQSFDESKTILRNGELRSGTQKKAKHMASFFKENFSLTSTLRTISSDFTKNWNPFANPFNANNTGIGKIINKDFFNLKNMAKGNGVVNVLLSTGDRIIDFAKNPKKSFASTDFAAGITTDMAFGVGTTAISAGVGWGAAAATGAAFGSVVPGLGTIIGAGVGVGLSFALASPAGKRFKRKVEDGVKKVFDGVVNIGSSIKNKLSGIFG
ncbi:hypothetical protein [Bacillus sp. B15-48]|uniref:hypothetical protein n=1 Tax=Bacillus sp. B15-48 TaxID=1548601 RepID=UPI00193F7B92|nr:hypothetical protein [Bacillus sp. B15-48]MBM4763248.1 hypothetical protein [Bacillus sp. B15-48]